MSVKDVAHKIITIAQLAHEANRAYCESIGDHSQPSWRNAPDWQKESAINGVEFTLADPSSTPRQSHENWMRMKLEDGWSYGPVKDPENKRHPCIMSYEELPEDQRVKDIIFRSVVLGMAAAFADEVTEEGTIYEGTPDERYDEKLERVSVFRPRYRKLTSEELDLHDRIKSKAQELYDLFDESGKSVAAPGDPMFGKKYQYLGTGKLTLEESVMWVVKALTM